MTKRTTLALQLTFVLVLFGCAAWLLTHRHRPANHLTDTVMAVEVIAACASSFLVFRQAAKGAGL